MQRTVTPHGSLWIFTSRQQNYIMNPPHIRIICNKRFWAYRRLDEYTQIKKVVFGYVDCLYLLQYLVDENCWCGLLKTGSTCSIFDFFGIWYCRFFLKWVIFELVYPFVFLRVDGWVVRQKGLFSPVFFCFLVIFEKSQNISSLGIDFGAFFACFRVKKSACKIVCTFEDYYPKRKNL